MSDKQRQIPASVLKCTKALLGIGIHQQRKRNQKFFELDWRAFVDHFWGCCLRFLDPPPPISWRRQWVRIKSSHGMHCGSWREWNSHYLTDLLASLYLRECLQNRITSVILFTPMNLKCSEKADSLSTQISIEMHLFWGFAASEPFRHRRPVRRTA